MNRCKEKTVSCLKKALSNICNKVKHVFSGKIYNEG